MIAAPTQFRAELAQTAKAIVADGKGILAADESTGTIGKRFTGIGVENVEANRRAYRELLFTCGKQLAQHIGGVILFEETLNQATADGIPFPKLLADNGIIVGIKVDKVLSRVVSPLVYMVRGLLFFLVLMERLPLRASMVLPSAAPITTRKVPASPNGAQSSKSANTNPPNSPSTRTPTPLLVTLPSAKLTVWSRLLSLKS